MKYSLFQSLKSCFKPKDSSSSSTTLSKNSLNSASTSSSLALPSQPAPPASPRHTTPQPQNDTSVTTSPAQFEALYHWSVYGQPGYGAADPGPQETVVKADWQSKEWRKAVRGCWVVKGADGDGDGDGDASSFRRLRISGDVLRVLERGFKPREMEDKWFVYCENMDLPDAESRVGGNVGAETRDDMGREAGTEHEHGGGKSRRAKRKIRVCFCRSWTGKRVVEIEVEIEISRPRGDQMWDRAPAETQESITGPAHEAGRQEHEGEDDREEREEEGLITAMIWDDVYPEETLEECQENLRETVKEVCRWVLGVEMVEN